MYSILLSKFEGNLATGPFSMFFSETSSLKIVYEFYKCSLSCLLITERIRKMIFSNFGSILDEMQMTLAMETLSECIGNVDEIKQNIMQVQNTRRQRMFSFLRFILQNDHNVVAFEQMLERNGLEDILKEVEGEDTASREIGMSFKKYNFPKAYIVSFTRTACNFI